MESVKVKFKQH